MPAATSCRAINPERILTVLTPIAADIARRSTERLARSATPDAPLRPPTKDPDRKPQALVAGARAVRAEASG
jgi:hypothetical protein